MIIQTTRISRAGGVAYLAAHLLDKTGENDRIEVLAGDRNALHDAHALARVKGCRYSVRHLSVSPEREMSPSDLSSFMRMMDVEFGIGADRPRLVVRHIKKGRSHFHIAIAEVDPATFRVLGCRNDFARLEDLARRYEQDHGEHVQPNRSARRAARIEGFSDVGRKRAERVSPNFDRTKLRAAFAKGAAAFLAELETRGLRLADGKKGAILITSDGVFVAAANRAAGARKNEFLKFMEGMQNERLIGTQNRAPGYPRKDGTQHRAPSAASEPIRDAGGIGQDREIDGTVAPHSGCPAAAGGRVEVRRRQDGSPLSALTRRRSREELILSRLGKELDELLRRAQELATWMMSIFEPKTDHLARRIEEAKKRKSFPPAMPTTTVAPTYDCRWRTPP
ncbi:relaxase/mobilization nuclease domain-containing protein [Sinorhizobium meliloti]|nr:relaxase/mobilization nuclease domain-containing protein [Sinorhizobium meliloti]MDX0032275.1 relaxase/mobilization nuclease domain-containing protein [Sinorhizobium meliloti]